MARYAWIALVTALVAPLVLGGCDVATDVNFTKAETAERLGGRVAELEAEAAAQQVRADRLQGELTALQETSFVRHGDGEFSFRLNTQAAWVLAIACMSIAAIWIARIKYSSAASSEEESA